MRVSSNARSIPDARSPAEAIDLLRRVRALAGRTFWHDDVSPAESDAGPFARLVGYRQVSDAHLVTLAIRRGGRLATFDRGLLDLVPGDPSAVERIV